MKLLELSSNTSKISTQVAEDDFLELLKSQARNSYDAIRRTPIFTNVDTKEPFFVADPSQSKRTSKFMIDGLITLLPSWRGWTNRLESVRGWTDRKIAESRGHGKLCLLIPYDKARVHTCATSSFYKSFEKAHAKMEIDKVDNIALLDWLESLYAVAKTVNEKLKYKEPQTAVQFLKALDALNAVRKDVLKPHDDKGDDRVDQRRAKVAFAEALVDSLDRILDPDTNGFATFTSLYNLPDNREVWTGSKCLVITVEEYEAMHKRGVVK